MIDLLVQALLYISGILAILGSIGMLRFPDFYTRVHAATMVSIGGVCLAALSLIFLTFGTIQSVKLAFILVFIILTNPTTSHALADAAHRRGIEPQNTMKDDIKK
jgi:multicomponent Na+:H+ antiporter subunit G